MTQSARPMPLDHEPSESIRWQAITNRDPQADGQFFYGVTSTGIYCMPSCPSRQPQRHNVRFFTTAQAAENAGFRPCKRCHPATEEAPHIRSIIQACRLLETVQPAPKLQQLADAVGLSKDYFQRLFKRELGLTPKAYAQAHMMKKIRHELTGEHSMTDAIYAAGYNASSRFYSKSQQILGMPARHYRQRGQHETIRFAIGQASLGKILVAQSQKGICAIFMGDDPDLLLQDLQQHFANAELLAGDQAFNALVAQVIRFIETPGMSLNLPLDIRGTAFQQRVWQVLNDIPPGSTASYREIAQLIDAPKASRAVATACASNTLAVAIPCHRVVRSNGDLSGYRWGVARKSRLLANEKQVFAGQSGKTQD